MQGPKSTVSEVSVFSSLPHPPLQNPAGEFGLELDFEAQGGGGDGGEGDATLSRAGDSLDGEKAACLKLLCLAYQMAFW
jgi:hypothetical protein